MRDPFWWLTMYALLGIFVLTLVGTLTTTRPRTPSISVMIDDEPGLRLVYGLFVGLLTVSRTGLVFTSTFYALPNSGHFWDKVAPWAAFACGSLQLVCFSLVGMFSVVQDPWYHYAAALGTVVFGFVCELLLLYRRYLSDVVKEWALLENLFVFAGMYVSLLVFGVYTRLDTYNELRTNVGIAEWEGYYLVAFVDMYRKHDVFIHRLQQRSLSTRRKRRQGGESSV